MSLLDRFRERTDALPEAPVEEHQAVVELLTMAAFADDKITEAELEELAGFDTGHTSWDDAGFSVLQHLPVAMAQARAGTQTVAQVAERISTPSLRVETIAAVTELVCLDTIAPAESAFLSEVRRALGP